MRKGGPLAELRRSISHSPEEACSQPFPGRITLKLFNLVAKELGPQFLARGIVVNSRALGELFRRQTPNFWQGVKSVEIDGSRGRVDERILQDWPEQEVMFQVTPT